MKSLATALYFFSFLVIFFAFVSITVKLEFVFGMEFFPPGLIQADWAIYFRAFVGEVVILLIGLIGFVIAIVARSLSVRIETMEQAIAELKAAPNEQKQGQ